MNRPLRNAGHAAPALRHALLAGASLIWPAAVSAELLLHDAWMGAVPPSSKVAAVYLVIENAGPEAVTLDAAVSPVAPRIELHQSVHSADRVRMEQRDHLVLAPGERLDFSTTGHHYMLFFEGQPVPAPGDHVPLSISVTGGATLEVTAEVRRAGAADTHDHSTHDHSAHDHSTHDHSAHEGH